MIPLVANSKEAWARFLQLQDALFADADLSDYKYVVTLEDDKFLEDPMEPNPTYLHEHHLLRLLENALLTSEGWIGGPELASARAALRDVRFISLCNTRDPQGFEPLDKICMVAFVWNRIKFVYKRELVSSSLEASPYKA